MPQSFKKRFAGREKEIVDEIKLDGWYKFCEREGITGFGIQRWFQGQPGCKNDSVYRYISSDSPVQGLPLVKQIMLAIQKERSTHADILAKDKARMDGMARQIKFYEEQLRYYRLLEYKNLKPIWELVRISNKGDPV